MKLVSGRAAAIAALALLPALALAQQPAFFKTPVGPGISINQMTNQITAQVDEVIEWQIDMSNSYSEQPVYADFWDTPQDDECAGGQSRPFLSGTQQGGTTENAPQTAISFLDTNGDGNCEETVLDAAGGLAICDAATQTLTIYNAFVPGMTPGFPPTPGTAQIRFLTYLDRSVPPGEVMCNWGFVYDDKETPAFDDDELLQPTSHPNRRTFGCTCMFAAPPNTFDMEAIKTVQPDRLPLIPNDPASTLVYTITARNTGGEDITSGTLSDQLPAGLEWVEVVTCPPPLTCTITGDTLDVGGWNIPAADPDLEQTVQARAKVTCAAATDDDSGVLCNRGEFSVGGQTIYTDDPDVGGIQDPTCINVVWSNLTQSEKSVLGYDDTDADGLLSAGDTVHFRINARNTGRLTARDVVIRDAGLDATCFDLASIVAFDGGTVAGGVITWSVGDIPGPLGSRDVKFDVVLAADQVCCNQAELNSAERRECAMAPLPTDDPTTTTVNDDPACALPGPRPDLKQDKTFALEDDRDASGDLSNDDIVSYTVTITNVGAGTATGAQFRDDLLPCQFRFLALLPDNLPGSRIWPNEIATSDGADWGVDNSVPYAGAFGPGSVIVDGLGGANGIVPGEIITIKFYFRVQQMARCCNQSFVTYTELPVPDPSDDPRTPGLVDDQTCFVDPPSGAQAIFDKAVEVFDIDGDGYLGVGDRGRFTLSYTSSGTVPLTSVRITDAGNACYTVVPGSVVITGAATDNSAGETVRADATAPMSPSDVLTVAFDVTWNVEGTCCNQATADAVELPGVPSNDPRNFIADDATCTEVVAPPRPDISMAVGKSVLESGCVEPGTVLHYTVRVTNTGADPVATWSLQDVLPPELTAIVATPPLAVAGNTVSVSDLPLASGEFVDLVYEAQVPCTGSGSVTNQAELAYDAAGIPRTAVAETTSSWGAPDLTTSSKTQVIRDSNGDGIFGDGEIIEYTITVANSGSCDAKGVVVTDALPAALDAAAAVIGQGGTPGAGTVTWDSSTTAALAVIPAGSSVTLTVSAPLAAGTPSNTRVDNVAAIVATGHPTTICFAAPRHDASSPGACANCFPPLDTQDLLRNAAVSSRQAAFSELPTLVFTGLTPNVTTCGDSHLVPARDTIQVDVAATLPSGLTVAGDGASGGAPLVFYEVTERCQSDEGGADNPICVSRTPSGDVVVRTSATPGTCN